MRAGHDHDAHGPAAATHAHGHDHGHGHGLGHHHAHDGPRDYSRAFVIGIVLNSAFVVVEALFGWRAGSLALLADAGHNLSDVAGLLIGWAGTMVATMRPTARRTYGWKRGSILAAFANAVLLLVAMGSLAWEAIGRLHTPVVADGYTVMVVAGIGILVNGGTALLFLRGGHDLNVRGAFLHMAADALVSAGVVISGALGVAYGWTWLDPVTSLVVTVLIVFATWSLFRQSFHLLVDGVPEGIDLHAVRRQLEALPGVERVHDLHVWAMGTTETALTAHLVMPDATADDAFLEAATHDLEHRFGIGHVTLQKVSRPFTPPCDAPPCAPADAGAGQTDNRHAAGAHEHHS